MGKYLDLLQRAIPNQWIRMAQNPNGLKTPVGVLSPKGPPAYHPGPTQPHPA